MGVNTMTWSVFQSGSTDSFERSGNPGYVMGQPVLAGTLNQTTTGDVTTYPLLDQG